MSMTPATAPDIHIPDYELEVEPESKLEGLLAQLEDAQAQAKEAAKRFDDLKDQIKNEVQAKIPGRPRVRINSKFLSKPWIMRYQEGWRIDSKMLKAIEPFIWAKYATQTKAWYLEAVKEK